MEWIGSKLLAAACLQRVDYRMWEDRKPTNHGERGLHGGVSNLPAEIESIIQPDPDTRQNGHEHYGKHQTNKSIRSQP